MVAAGGFLGTEHRAFSGSGSHVGLRVSLCWVLLSYLVSQLPAPSNPFKPALSGLAFSTQHPGSCHRPRTLGKMSGLLQNTLELYLTPGSCPNQKYIGWNLQPILCKFQYDASEPGGWRRKSALDHRPDMPPHHPALLAPLFICTILLMNAASSHEVIF